MEPVLKIVATLFTKTTRAYNSFKTGIAP